MLYVENRGPEPRVPLAEWKSEAKMADLRALSSAEAAQPPDTAPAIVLQNFPEARLTWWLYDLEEKRVVGQGEFRRTCTLAAPAAGRHFFLVASE